MKRNELDPKTENAVEVISIAIVLIAGATGLYYISVFAGWIEPIF